MKQQYLFVVGALALALLAGCGGGGGGSGTSADNTGGTGGTGGTVAAAMDKYVGTWAGCTPSNSGTGSRQETVTVTKSTDTTGAYTQSSVDYPASGCTGTPSASSTTTGTVALTGTKTVGSDTVDEAVTTEGTNAPQKQVLLVKGTPSALFTGVAATDGGPVDANGYPTTLATSGLVQQSGSTSTSTGGTGTASGATTDKYVGTWAACIANSSGSGSHSETLAIAKSSDVLVTFNMTRLDYTLAGCSGAATTTIITGTVQFTGTSSIAGATVDDGLLTQGTSAPEKQVFLVQGTGPVTLTAGVMASDGGPVDANGYPTTLDNHPLTKQ